MTLAPAMSFHLSNTSRMYMHFALSRRGILDCSALNWDSNLRARGSSRDGATSARMKCACALQRSIS
eukprot:214761-Pyramimonas_sp.AAC.1